MRILTLSALVLLVSLLTIAIGISVHRACSISLSSTSFIGECFKPSLISKQNEVEQRSHASLLAEIDRLENKLAVQACKKEPMKLGLTKLDKKKWNEQDVSVLSSCWKLLGDEYQTSDMNDPTKITIFNKWKMCFDSDGNGDQILTGSNAPICKGELKAKFLADETLAITDLTDVFCDKGGNIIRREAICVLSEAGVAECLFSQPDHPLGKKGSHKVLLQRDSSNKISEKK